MVTVLCLRSLGDLCVLGRQRRMLWIASSFLPPVQGFHIDAGDFAAVHGFDVSEVGVDGMEGVFHFTGFRVFSV